MVELPVVMVLIFGMRSSSHRVGCACLAFDSPSWQTFRLRVCHFVLLQSYGEMASRLSQWRPEERGAVPSQSAGSWETGWGAAQWEEYERPEVVPRQKRLAGRW